MHNSCKRNYISVFFLLFAENRATFITFAVTLKGCMNRHVSALIVMMLLLGSCTVPKEITNEIFDRDIDDLFKNTVVEYIIDAKVGGETGAAVKKEMVLLRDNLQQVLDIEGIQIRQPDEGVLVVFPSDMVFKSGKSDVREQFLPVITDLRECLRDFPQTQLYLYVHTDNNGSDYKSLTLSEKRAKKIRKAFRKSGIKHIFTQGKGSMVPVITNETEEGRRLNRRVEIAIVANRKMLAQARKRVN